VEKKRLKSINFQVVLSFGIILLVITLAKGLSGSWFSIEGMNSMRVLHEETLLTKLDCDVKNIYRSFNEYFGELTIKGETLFDENGNKINDDDKFVDSVFANYKNLATVFVRSGNDFKRISTNILNETGQSVVNGETYIGNALILGKSFLTLYKPLYIDGKVNAILFIGLEDEEIKNQMNDFYNKLQMMNVLTTLIAMIVGLTVIYFISVRITTPIKRLSESLKRVAGYDLTDEKDAFFEKILANGTEIGDMGRNIQTMKHNLKFLANNIKEQSDSLDQSTEDMFDIAHSQQSESLELEKMVKLTEQETQTTNLSVQEVATGVESITESAQEISTATIEISAQTEQTSELTNSRLQIMREVIGNIEQTSIQMKKTAEITADLSNKAENVGEIVNTISSIAEQTNLLALNAAIEAARAGEAGKGFAVVADEIRKLAEESKKATIDISDILGQITKSVKDVDSATDVTGKLVKTVTLKTESISAQFGKIAENIEKVSENIGRLSASSEEQSASTEEISAAMDTSAKAVGNISENLKVVAQTAKIQSERSEHLSEAAGYVKTITENLRNEIRKFKL
jgi:methyl-accepting chemotaxis protein